MGITLRAASVGFELLVLLASMAAPFIVWKMKDVRKRKISVGAFGALVLAGLIIALMGDKMLEYQEGDWFAFSLYYIFALPLEILFLVAAGVSAFTKKNGLIFLAFMPLVMFVFLFIFAAL